MVQEPPYWPVHWKLKMELLTPFWLQGCKWLVFGEQLVTSAEEA